MAAAQASVTPLERVELWPWHKTVAAWAEARDVYRDRYEATWEPLLRLWYKRDD